MILTVATASKLKGNYIYGFAIGLTVAALAFSVGALSGGAFNPAVALGPMLTGVLIGSSVPDGYLCAYIVSPILGGILAAVVFGYLNEE